jgi:hypothetical protein
MVNILTFPPSFFLGPGRAGPACWPALAITSTINLFFIQGILLINFECNNKPNTPNSLCNVTIKGQYGKYSHLSTFFFIILYLVSITPLARYHTRRSLFSVVVLIFIAICHFLWLGKTSLYAWAEGLMWPGMARAIHWRSKKPCLEHYSRYCLTLYQRYFALFDTVHHAFREASSSITDCMVYRP